MFQEKGAGVGVGLAGMRARMSESGGTLAISSDTNGTTVQATVPILERRTCVPARQTPPNIASWQLEPCNSGGEQTELIPQTILYFSIAQPRVR